MTIAESEPAVHNATEAVRIARQAAMEVFGDDAATPPSLEAVRPDGATWLVWLSFRRAKPLAAGALGFAMDPDLTNYRKVFRIAADTGGLIEVFDDRRE